MFIKNPKNLMALCSLMQGKKHIGLLLLLNLVLITSAYARIDAMQLRLLEPYQQDMRWDNIESAPAWVNGIKPDYNKNWQMHRVSLKPSQQVNVRLPAYESLRLYHPKQILTTQDLDVYVSNGTGLAVKQTLQPSTDGHSLIFSPQSPTPLLIHIVNPLSLATTGGREGEFEVALFMSRKVTLNDIAPYRNLIFLSAPWVLLTLEPFTLPELYWRLEAFQKHSFVVQGPSRLAIKNRLSYEPHSSELIQDYRLQYQLDHNDKQWLDFATGVETSRLIAEIISFKNPVNTALNVGVGLLLSTAPAPIVEVVGREQQAYIEIPAGLHRVELQPDRSLYVQVLAQTEHDYLFPALNNPRTPVEAIRKQGLLASTELMLQDQTSKRIVQNNNRQEGGMVGSLHLQQSAFKRLDYPAGLTEAEQLRGFRTFYRDLLPSKKATSSPQFMSYFLSEDLRAVDRPQQDAILADQHLADALKRVASGYFTAIDATAEHVANEYTLPEQHTAGQLRLIVDKRNCVPRLLKIQMDQRQPTDLWLRCNPDMPADAFVRSLDETALIRLQQEYEHPVNATLSALFSTYQQPARLIPTAVYEIPLPQPVRSIKIWQTSNLTAPVNLALQYRSSKPFLFSEASYLARLHESSRSRLQQHFFQDLNNLASDRSLPEQQLHNEWLPLERLLLSEYRLFKSWVAQKPVPQALYSKAPTNDSIALAKSAEQQQQWLEALEYWGNVVHHSQGLQQQQAQLAQATVLSKMGEHYLAESLRRYLSLYADESIAEQAIQQLVAEYQIQHDTFALQTLAAAILVKRPSTRHMLMLTDALLQNGEYRFVLLLGLTFLEQAPSESLLRAAYQLEWWHTYQRLLDQLPIEKRAFWIGMKAQKQGHYQAALQAWSSDELKAWREHLQQGRDILNQFNRVNEKNAPPLYQQWSAWQQRHPGSKMWQEAPWYVQDYAGCDGYDSTERDLYSKAFRATVMRPVVLGVMGPTTLNLRIRPLHAGYSGTQASMPRSQPDDGITGVSALDGWITIDDNNKTHGYPFFNNTPSQGLVLSGSGNVQAGILETLDYQVGSGWHEIRVFSEQAPLSVSVHEQRPELALTVLPLLHPDTFDGMFFMKDRSIAGTWQRETP